MWHNIKILVPLVPHVLRPSASRQNNNNNWIRCKPLSNLQRSCIDISNNCSCGKYKHSTNYAPFQLAIIPRSHTRCLAENFPIRGPYLGPLFPINPKAVTRYVFTKQLNRCLTHGYSIFKIMQFPYRFDPENIVIATLFLSLEVIFHKIHHIRDDPNSPWTIY